MKLSQPSKELVKKILSEVEFDDRIIGYRMRERTGPLPVTLYSFEEIVILLTDQHPRIDYHTLSNWLRKVMGDDEMANRIKDIAKPELSDQDKTLRIRDLMGERLIQCKNY
jgi:hypothetical protein